MQFYQFKPLYMERIWGGHKLSELYGREIPADKLIGESWELVDRPQEQSDLVGAEGSLHTLWAGAEKEKIFGKLAPDSERFPILIKILDASDKLSLQVHPPAALAPKFHGEPKTEMWYFLHTEPDAEIYVGLKRGITKAAFAQSITEKKVADCFHRLPTAPRETMFLPSGRVHAIGSGNVILEIQQNSDTTFRVYDWDRIDSSGKPRDLHVAESLECIKFDDYEPQFVQPHGEKIVSNPLFHVERASFYEQEERTITLDGSSFQFVFVTSGEFEFLGRTWKVADTALLRADAGSIDIKLNGEFGELVCVSFPPR